MSCRSCPHKTSLPMLRLCRTIHPGMERRLYVLPAGKNTCFPTGFIIVFGCNLEDTDFMFPRVARPYACECSFEQSLSASLLDLAHWLLTSWLHLDLNGVVRTPTRGIIPRDICHRIMKESRCCYQIASLDISWSLHKARGTTTSWVSQPRKLNASIAPQLRES